MARRVECARVLGEGASTEDPSEKGAHSVDDIRRDSVAAGKGQPVDRHPVRAKRVAEGLGHRDGKSSSPSPWLMKIGRPRRASKRVAHSFAAMCVPDMRTSPASARDERSATSRASIAPCEKPPSTSLAAAGRSVRSTSSRRSSTLARASSSPFGMRLVSCWPSARRRMRSSMPIARHARPPPFSRPRPKGVSGKTSASPAAQRGRVRGGRDRPWRAEPVEKDDDGPGSAGVSNDLTERPPRFVGFMGPFLSGAPSPSKVPPRARCVPTRSSRGLFGRAKGDSRASRGISMGSIGALLSFNEVQMGSRVTRELYTRCQMAQ